MNMGTRFMATKEAPIHPNVKEAIVKGGVDSTRLVLRSMRNTERVFANQSADEVLRLEKEFPGDFSKVKHLVAGVVYKRVFHETGNVNEGIWSAGIVMGLIDDVPTCDQLINTIVKDAVDIIQGRLAKSVVA